MRWLVALVLFFPTFALGQVNVEALRSNGTEDGLAGSLGLSAAYTNGNILFADFGATANLEWLKGKDSVFFIMNHRFAAKRTQSDLLNEPDIGLWDEEAHFSNNRLVHLRYNRALSERFSWEAYTQYEYNEFLLLDRRLLGGTGPRLTVIDGTSVGLWVGTSAMVEEESLNPDGISPLEEVSRINLRSSTYASLTVRPSESVSWTTTAYFQPRVDELADHRIAAESGLGFAMGKRLSFTVDARYRKDSEPPQTPDGSAPVLASDFTIKNGLKISF
jgi:hypothetical protein